MYGVSEYEVLDEDEEDPASADQEEDTGLVQASESSLNQKLRQISVLSSEKTEERSKNVLTVVETFKYLYLQLRWISAILDKEFLINRIRLTELCRLSVLHCTCSKSKQTTKDEVNIIVRVTVTNLLYTHKHTPHPPPSLTE